jgi:hypothetical protein
MAVFEGGDCMVETLPQQYPRELSLLRLEDVLHAMVPGAQEAYAKAFAQHEAEPLDSRGLILAGPYGIRPLMAFMRLMVLRLRHLKFERFEQYDGKDRLLSAYVQGATLSAPLPELASALFIERADEAPASMADALAALPLPIFSTWEGETTGPIWAALQERCEVIWLQEDHR